MWVDFPILDPYSSHMALPMWVQHGTLLQIPHESLMGCPCRTHINTHLGPMWDLYFLLAGFRVSRKSLEQIYVSFIRPLLEYCDVVWDNCSAEIRNNSNRFT